MGRAAHAAQLTEALHICRAVGDPGGPAHAKMHMHLHSSADVHDPPSAITFKGR